MRAGGSCPTPTAAEFGASTGGSCPTPTTAAREPAAAAVAGPARAAPPARLYAAVPGCRAAMQLCSRSSAALLPRARRSDGGFILLIANTVSWGHPTALCLSCQCSPAAAQSRPLLLPTLALLPPPPTSTCEHSHSPAPFPSLRPCPHAAVTQTRLLPSAKGEQETWQEGMHGSLLWRNHQLCRWRSDTATCPFVRAMYMWKRPNKKVRKKSSGPSTGVPCAASSKEQTAPASHATMAATAVTPVLPPAAGVLRAATPLAPLAPLARRTAWAGKMGA